MDKEEGISQLIERLLKKKSMESIANKMNEDFHNILPMAELENCFEKVLPKVGKVLPKVLLGNFVKYANKGRFEADVKWSQIGQEMFTDFANQSMNILLREKIGESFISKLAMGAANRYLEGFVERFTEFMKTEIYDYLKKKKSEEKKRNKGGNKGGKSDGNEGEKSNRNEEGNLSADDDGGNIDGNEEGESAEENEEGKSGGNMEGTSADGENGEKSENENWPKLFANLLVDAFKANYQPPEMYGTNDEQKKLLNDLLLSGKEKAEM